MRKYTTKTKEEILRSEGQKLSMMEIMIKKEMLENPEKMLFGGSSPVESLLGI